MSNREVSGSTPGAYSSYAILIAEIVLSLDSPDWLNLIWPLVLVVSLQEMRRFPAGFARYPERETVIGLLAAWMFALPLAMTVVPSQSFTWTTAAPAVSSTTTDPETNHVPTDP
jgi:hypothetical protein